MDISFSRETAGTRLVPLLVIALIASAVVLPAFGASRPIHPIAGDWDCDGVTSAGWFVDGLVLLQSSKEPGGSLRFNYGRPGDHPVVGDWNNDGCDTIGVVRKGRHWYLKNSNSSGAADHAFAYGSRLGRDRPVVGDWDGRGGDSPGVVRGSTWHLRNSLSGGPAHLTFAYGRVARGDLPIAGDWTNDGRDTPGIVRDGVWYLRDHNRAGHADTVFPYGRKNDLPVSGNWDGRGGDSPGVVRGTTWMVKNSTAGGMADGTFRYSDKTVDAALEDSAVESLRRPAKKPAPVAKPKLDTTQQPEPTPATVETTLVEEQEETKVTSGEESPPDETNTTLIDGGLRLLFSASEVRQSVERMGTTGPYFAAGDAGHGGPNSPGDGQRSLDLAEDFLANPGASYWVQFDLPYSQGDRRPSNAAYVQPMHAAWVYMTQPGYQRRTEVLSEVRRLLLAHAEHPSLDYSDASDYPVDYPGYAPNPIVGHAHWMTRLIKARDMIGRDSFTAQENAVFDRWLYDYANWSFKWLHEKSYGKLFPEREARDYSTIDRSPDASRRSYDGGPRIGSVAMAYTNRHAAVASSASLAANYLAFWDYRPTDASAPSYGRLSVDDLLLHSRLFVEETIRFSVYPEGLQGDFERGDNSIHSSASPQQGWLYSVNVLSNLIEIADYHAKRGDMSVWNYGTSEGFDGTEGAPIVRAFPKKNLHFFAWSMSRYVNNGWGRTNRGEPLALPHFYHDVIPAAIASEYVPSDDLLMAAWRRSGFDFPPYPERPQSQGMWHAHRGEGAKTIGLIEHAG